MKESKGNHNSNKMGRRGMLKSVLAATATMGFSQVPGMEQGVVMDSPGNVTWRPVRSRLVTRGPLTMQPVLVYQIPQRREGASWRTWSGLITEAHAEEERNRINAELESLKKKVNFPLVLLPLVSVRSPEEANAVAAGQNDGLIVYANGGPMYNTSLYVALMDKEKLNIVFVRHQSGPAYYYYCGAQHRLLRQGSDEFRGIADLQVEDIVVDDYDEMVWRLRAFNGLKGALGKRVVCIGGPWGHSAGQAVAPDNARTKWEMDLIDIPYTRLDQLIEKAFQNKALVKNCTKAAQDYLDQPGVKLFPLQEQLTTKELFEGKGSTASLPRMKSFLERACVLKEIFLDLMNEYDTNAITVGGCMGPVINSSKTTACMTLTMLNDSGYLAFCESDFVVIPASILLHYIAGTPVFFGNPTFPHNNQVTLAHCSSPRKMNGITHEPVKLRTHFESDYGVAPKVEMRVGQDLTVIIPDFSGNRWAGFEGKILANPELDICTTQIDIGIKGSCDRLVKEIRGFHWPVCYGNYLREFGYAMSKTNVDWLNLTENV